MHHSTILGVDLGNTIVRAQRRSDLEPGAARPLPVAYPDALETLYDLGALVKEIHIVSRVTPEQKVRALQWLEASDFYTKTNIPKTRVHFCAERHEKAGICKPLGITHFIDDRPEVLAHMHGVIKIAFDPHPSDFKKFEKENPDTLIVSNWQDVRRYFKLP